jgi:hypothetical protein
MPLTSSLYNVHPEELMFDEPDVEHQADGFAGGRFRTFTGEATPGAVDKYRESVLLDVIEGNYNMKEAAKLMQLSYSFARELMARYKDRGIAGIVPIPRVEALYQQLTEVISRRLQVGQELCLDAPSRDELVRYIKATKLAARHLGAELSWLGLEAVTLRVEHNPDPSAERPWSVRRHQRFRAYLLLRARRTASGWLAGSGVATVLR